MRVGHRPDGLEVDVLDDGAAAPEREDEGAGAGLRGMRERAAVYGGELDAGPSPSGGWHVRLRVPLGRPVVAA